MRQLGRYAAHHALGRGGMATVYFGTLRGPSGFVRRVAIKELHASLGGDGVFRTMLAEEARIQSRITHTNTVAVVDIVEEGENLFVVMDYVYGASLNELLNAARKRGGSSSASASASPWRDAFPVSIASAIMADALSGLAAAHAARDTSGKPLDVVHRDISPDNVLVGADGVARLSDFGIARAEGRMLVTESGVLKGKFRYMSPEQANGEASQASDQFSMAVVLWETLAGKKLFDGETEPQVLNQVLSMAIKPPSAFSPDVPKELDDVVLRALSRDPEKRFASAGDMCDALIAAAPPADDRKTAAWVNGLAKELLDAKLALIELAERQAESATGTEDSITVKKTPTPALGVSRPIIRQPREESVLDRLVSPEAPTLDARPSGHTPPPSVDPTMPRVRRAPPPKIPPVLAGALAAFGAFALILAARYVFTMRSTPAAAPVTTPVQPQMQIQMQPQTQMQPQMQPQTQAQTPTRTQPQTQTPETLELRDTSLRQEAGSSSAMVPPPRNVPTRPRPPPAVPAATVDCSTPFVIDSAGVRVYRRECLQ